MIFLSVCTKDTSHFDHCEDIIHINILTSVRVEPTNAACASSTALSDTLSHYTTIYFRRGTPAARHGHGSNTQPGSGVQEHWLYQNAVFCTYVIVLSFFLFLSLYSATPPREDYVQV